MEKNDHEKLAEALANIIPQGTPVQTVMAAICKLQEKIKETAVTAKL